MSSLLKNNGYLHPHYAEAFSAFGEPRFLPLARAWILQRKIAPSSYQDAIGLYPLLCCQSWPQLAQEFSGLADDGIVTISAVTDPFGDYDEANLRVWFKDIVYPYKTHFVVDLGQPAESFVSSHHLRNVRKAHEKLEVEVCASPKDWLDEWVKLYAVLIERHQITGMTAFSRDSFEHQLQVSGLTMFRAFKNDETLGISLWYTQGHISYYHLAAYSNIGYELNASFGLFWQAIKHFAEQGLHWLSLGAGAGIQGNSNDGLSRFKRGWSNATRTAYFCGRILNHDRYALLKGNIETTYFPAYRASDLRNEG